MNENIWKKYSEESLRELEEISARYKKCLDAGKTERECSELIVDMAQRAGYRDIFIKCSALPESMYTSSTNS